MNRHERRRQEKEVRQRARSRGEKAGSMVADQVTADAFGAALALQQAGRLAEAERAWENLRATMPDHDGVNVNLATVLWRLGRLDDAATACRRAIASNPNLAEAHAMLGVILQAQGTSGRRCQLERAVHLRDDLVTTRVQLANHAGTWGPGRGCTPVNVPSPGTGARRYSQYRESSPGICRLGCGRDGLPRSREGRADEPAPGSDQSNLAALYMVRERFDVAASCRAAIEPSGLPTGHNIRRRPEGAKA